MSQSSCVRVAILKCDDVLDKFQGDFGNYPEMIMAGLKQENECLEFDVFDVRDGEYPEAINRFAFYVITGSRVSVYDDLPWIETFTQFVKKLHDEQIKLLGICFGHQVIAKALGCQVSKSEKGWGVGVSSNEVMATGFFNEELDELRLLVSHQDQVDNLPDSAQVIAKSDFCPNFLVQWSDTTLSVQGHPEWVKGYSRDLMNDRRDRIPHSIIESGLESLSLPLNNKQFNQAVLRFFSI